MSAFGNLSGSTEQHTDAYKRFRAELMRELAAHRTGKASAAVIGRISVLYGRVLSNYESSAGGVAPLPTQEYRAFMARQGR